MWRNGMVPGKAAALNNNMHCIRVLALLSVKPCPPRQKQPYVLKHGDIKPEISAKGLMDLES